MADIKRYFNIVNQIRSGKKVSDEDLQYFIEYTPEVDRGKINKLLESGEFTTFEEAQNALIEAGRLLQSSPEYKQQLIDFAQKTQASETSSKIAEGVNLFLGGVDVAQSINQITSANRASKRFRRPVRPAVPQRDIYLQQALRNAEQGVFDAARATAPVEAQINDQYLSDIQDAKTSSTGQAGAYGSYRQLAANRRNRAALNLAPIQDQVRRGQQERYDNLLGMRLQETQNQFQNNAQLYPYDLNQYNQDQQTAAGVGATGRLNLRDSLYNLGNLGSNFIGNRYANRRFKMYNDAMLAGLDPDLTTTVDKRLYETSGYNIEDIY